MGSPAQRRPHNTYGMRVFIADGVRYETHDEQTHKKVMASRSHRAVDVMAINVVIIVGMSEWFSESKARKRLISCSPRQRHWDNTTAIDIDIVFTNASHEHKHTIHENAFNTSIQSVCVLAIYCHTIHFRCKVYSVLHILCNHRRGCEGAKGYAIVLASPALNTIKVINLIILC